MMILSNAHSLLTKLHILESIACGARHFLALQASKLEGGQLLCSSSMLLLLSHSNEAVGE